MLAPMCFLLAVACTVAPASASASALAPAPARRAVDTCPANLWAAQARTVPFDPSLRLPGDLEPSHYDLRIDVDLGEDDKFDFAGNVDILVNVTKEASEVSLHSLNLTVAPVRVFEVPIESVDAANAATVREIGVKSQDVNAQQERLRVELSEPLLVNKKYVIKASFNGTLAQALDGLYRSTYIDRATNTTRWLAVTQFESTYARKAFPCFDEPRFKATFRVQLGHNASLTALSNMPAEKTEAIPDRPGFSLTTFATTKTMSTYLVAMLISDFYVIKADPVPGVAEVAIWGRRDAADQMAYARSITTRALVYFEEYFGIKYPLPKQDLVAIPDFAAGAMENWGLITFRETALLFDPSASTQSAQTRVANTVVHELAHQWFGNLVTMDWWSDLWLNEGFATYMASLVTAQLHPEWRLAEDAALSQAGMLAGDALESTHAVVRPIERKEQISGNFDSITYRKGSALLRMIHSFLGEAAFRRGVSLYLNRHAYANAEQDDLWVQLTAEGHRERTLPECLTVKRVMDTWTLQSGFPVVTVTRDYEAGTAAVTQERFFSSNRTSKAECWFVPLSYIAAPEVPEASKAAQSATDTADKDAVPDNETRPPQKWMHCLQQGADAAAPPASAETVSGLPGAGRWVLFNVNMAGPYRVLYDAENWRLITQALGDRRQRRALSVVSRTQVLDDAFQLAHAHRLDYAVPLGLAHTLRLEEENPPWQVAYNWLDGKLGKIIQRDDRFPTYRAWLGGALEAVFAKETSLREAVTDLQAVRRKNLVFSWACKLEVGDCVRQAQDLFAEWRASADPDQDNPAPKDQRALVNCVAIRHGTADDWSWLQERLRASNVAAQKVDILRALGCSRDPQVLRGYLDWTFGNDTAVRAQDAVFGFGYMTNWPEGHQVASAFLYERVQDIVGNNPASRRIDLYVRMVADGVSTAEEYEQLGRFTKEKSQFLTGADEKVRQALETARLNVEWREKHAPEFFSAVAVVHEQSHLFGRAL